jgi:hypothetical protein
MHKEAIDSKTNLLREGFDSLKNAFQNDSVMIHKNGQGKPEELLHSMTFEAICNQL